jgi:hypothetical protein
MQQYKLHSVKQGTRRAALLTQEHGARRMGTANCTAAGRRGQRSRTSTSRRSSATGTCTAACCGRANCTSSCAVVLVRLPGLALLKLAGISCIVLVHLCNYTMALGWKRWTIPHAGLGGWEREGFPGPTPVIVGTSVPQGGSAHGSAHTSSAGHQPDEAAAPATVQAQGSVSGSGPPATFCFHYRPRFERSGIAVRPCACASA